MIALFMLLANFQKAETAVHVHNFQSLTMTACNQYGTVKGF